MNNICQLIKFKKSFETLVFFNFVTVFPVIKFSFPIQRALKRNTISKISFIYPSYAHSRSQDLEDSFHDAA